LLEREPVLAEMCALLRAARRGAGRLVLLRGEAGIGKTAVIDRFVAGVDAGVRVLQGWCDPLAAPRPLGPLLDALAGVGAQAADALDEAIEAGDTGMLYRRLLAVLRDGHRWVWVIEDAHWADGATLDLIRFLGRRIASLSLLLVVSYRDDELGPQHPMTLLLGDLSTWAPISRIGLTPLTREAVAKLARGSGVNADQLFEVTGGNAFYVTEILAVGSEALSRNTLPRNVTEAVQGRLGRLSAGACHTAQAVAVCGARVNPALVQRVCDEAVTGLAECVAAKVLVAEGDVVGFRHELARRATLDQIPDYHRAALHKQVLMVLADSKIDPNTFAALAFHADQAGDRDAVIQYAPQAAERASSLGANREAAELYAITLRHGDTVPDEQKVFWLEQHAFSSYLCGLPHASTASFRDAITLRRKLGDRLGEGDNLRWLSHVVWPLGHTTEAVEAARASLRLLEEIGPCVQLAWSMAQMAELAAFGYTADCAEYAARAIELGTEFGDPDVVVRSRFYAALPPVRCDDTGWDELEAAWRAAMASDSIAEHAGITGVIVCWFAAMHRHLERAERYIAETTEFCDAHDLGGFLPYAVGSAALVAVHRGDGVAAVAHAEDVLTRPGLGSLHRILPLVAIALVGARRGDQSVVTLLDEALAATEPDNLTFLGVVWAARAEAAWLAGDLDTARTEALTGLAAATGLQADVWLVGQLRRWARLAGGPFDDSPVLDTVTPYRFEISGDWQAAADAWTRLGCPYDAAIAQLGGDIAALEAALATFRRLGARAAARRARERLTALRGPTRRSRRAEIDADPDGLSRRQREVLSLIAAGHSDIDIAGRLSLSPKTVGHHVAAILDKLGVANRTQAAAKARQVEPTEP
jgi:DNA-binding CsgD family transcriptional regulator